MEEAKRHPRHWFDLIGIALFILCAISLWTFVDWSAGDFVEGAKCCSGSKHLQEAGPAGEMGCCEVLK